MAFAPIWLLGVGRAPIVEYAIIEKVTALPLNLLAARLLFLNGLGEGFTASCVVPDVFGKSHEDRSAVGDGLVIFETTQKDNARFYAGVVMGKCELRQAHHGEELKALKERTDAIERMRNCVAHNRRPTKSVSENYLNARPLLNQMLDEYLARWQAARDPS